MDLGWYIGLHHPEHPRYVIDPVQRGHEAMPASFRGLPTGGLCLAFLVEEAAQRDEPWGQRRFNVLGPEGVLIEVVQPIAPGPEWLARQTAGTPA
ncbi:hypothetical protein [Kitasatospora sp. MBT63]|uniref:hypothetical protein n=1 Tax=Kitasatospora sp. MBT63 TaxID=1444768 RepID=UPI00068E7A2F|nr:hypothetical protein [Kitasatospora sp. MBT63]